MKLSEILNNIKVIQVTGMVETEIKNIVIDSREVRKNSMFVAIKGFKTDGHKFIGDAISKGATAVVFENKNAIPEGFVAKNDFAQIIVENSRKALAEISHVFYNKPSTKLKLIGITGTKGKTTTSYFIKSVLDKLEIKNGLIGTNKYMVGDKEYSSELTTPEANKINYLMNEMVLNGCEYCVMEVSSHSIALNRIDYLDFDFGVFTNITSDHMDFHKTFEDYLETKKIFFTHLKPGAAVIVNSDDPNWQRITDKTSAKVKTYGTKNNPDFRMSEIEYDLSGTKLTVSFNQKTYSLETKLIGKFNAYNATAAFSTLLLAGYDAGEVLEGIKQTPQVPGRFEVIGKGNKKIIIDYSHTADSLKEALLAIHHIVKDNRKIYTVFGCGGDRDRQKRPVMGKIAEDLSDFVIVTSDNPRSEDPSAIIDEIKKGMSKDNHIIIEDREEAIRYAVISSPEDAVVLVAGKGHENYQEIKGERKYFSDKDTALKYLN